MTTSGSLSAAGLLPDAAASASARRRLLLGALALLVGLAVAKIFSRAFAWPHQHRLPAHPHRRRRRLIAAELAVPPRTARGNALLATCVALRAAATPAAPVLPGGGTSADVALLAAVFGARRAAGSGFGFARTLYPRASSGSAARACGASCGSSCGGCEVAAAVAAAAGLRRRLSRARPCRARLAARAGGRRSSPTSIAIDVVEVIADDYVRRARRATCARSHAGRAGPGAAARRGGWASPRRRRWTRAGSTAMARRRRGGASPRRGPSTWPSCAPAGSRSATWPRRRARRRPSTALAAQPGPGARRGRQRRRSSRTSRR